MFFIMSNMVYRNLSWLLFGFDKQLQSAFRTRKLQSSRRTLQRGDLSLKPLQRKDMTAQGGQLYLGSLSLWWLEIFKRSYIVRCLYQACVLFTQVFYFNNFLLLSIVFLEGKSTLKVLKLFWFFSLSPNTIFFFWSI